MSQKSEIRRAHRSAVLVIAQAFKETLSAAEVAAALGRGVRRAGAEPRVMLGSDGGDGLLEALAPHCARVTSYDAPDPMMRPIQAPVGWLDDHAVVLESRLVCGLSLLAPDERDPLRTSTKGVGVVIQRVAADGARVVYVGLGGSATMDGGLGMARAWGWAPRDARGAVLAEGGGALSDLARLEPGRRPPVRLVGLCDVANPLLGVTGARLFAAQKGASAAAEARLAQGLERLATVAASGARDAAQRPGAGAAGGLGFGLIVFGGAELVAGAAFVLEATGFAGALDGARLVVTGEGAFDRSSVGGKLTGEVMQRAQAAGVPVLLLAPQATDVPPGVYLESGGGRWTATDLESRAAVGVARVLRLLGR